MDKLAQDDFLGRVMAHAFTDELNKLSAAGAHATKVKVIRKHIKGGGSTGSTGLPGSQVDPISGGGFTSPGTTGITPVKTPTV